MKRILILLALWLPGAAAAQGCAVLHEAALALLEKSGFDVTAPGALQEGAPCVVTGMAARNGQAGGFALEVARVEWTGSGLDPAGMLGGPAALDLTVTGLRWHPLTGMPQYDYMLDVQARRNLTDARFIGTWDPEAAVLDIAEASVDLPAKNALSLSLRLSDLHIGTLILRGTRGFPVALERLSVEIENTGYFDSLYMGALIGALGEDPRAEVEAFRARASALVAAMPGAALGDETRAALGALIAELPAPWGVVRLSIEPEGADLPLVEVAGALLQGWDDPDTMAGLLSDARLTLSFAPWGGWDE